MSKMMVDLESEILAITLELYANPVLPRSCVQLFTEKLFNFSTNIYATYIEQQMKSKNVDVKVLDVFNDSIKNSVYIFEKFSTEHKRFEMYKNKELMVEPIQCVIGTNFGKKNIENEICFDISKSTLHYIPLKWSLKCLLESPGIFDLLTSYMDELKTESLITSNFTQAELWKSYNFCDTDSVKHLPLIIYHDEFETGNALGSHAGTNKLGAVYASIPSFPLNISSQLNNILLVCLFYSHDRKLYGNAATFAKLVKELTELREEGIIITVNDKKFKIFFQLVLFAGDNLGLNEALGFVDNFASGKPCRICNEPMKNIKILTSENEKKIRTPESYEEDLKKNNCSETGIKENCIFHKVPGFHVCRNIYVDLMHDVFEGTAHYVLLNILNDLIYKQKIFSLSFLNERILTFQYGHLESSNKIPQLKREHILTRSKLKMSAAETMCFCRYLGLLVSDKVNDDNETWKIYVMFRKIISILTSPRFVDGHILELEQLIPEFLLQYKHLYGELKYKFHNMTHFVRVMKQHGPLIHTWCMRFESKHKELKAIAVSSSNTQNLPKSLCIKSVLRIAFFKINKNSSLGIHCNKRELIDTYTKQKYFPQSAKDNSIFMTNNIHVNNIQYKLGMVFVIEMGDDDLLVFGQITAIFINDDQVYLLMQPLKNMYFDEHMYVYNVKKYGKCILKNASKIPDIHPCLLVETDRSLFVATRYVL